MGKHHCDNSDHTELTRERFSEVFCLVSLIFGFLKAEIGTQSFLLWEKVHTNLGIEAFVSYRVWQKK